jgi:HD-GYP domain-containing protein (c-di-GMP phosphodiesterase class II)
MNARSRSIKRELILRTVVAGLVLAALVGSATFALERRRVAGAIEERAALGVELLRLGVRQLAQSRGESWQAVLPQALDGLVADMPVAALGRFVFVEILDAGGRRLAGVEDPALAGLASVARQRGFEAGADRLDIVPIRDDRVPGAVAISVPVSDRQGARVAQINGVFVVSPETIAQAQRRLAAAVLTAAAIVVVSTLLIYPLVGRLVRRLSDLSLRLLDANLETLQVLGNAIAKRDNDTDAHNYRVTIYSVRLAQAEGLDDALIRRLMKGAFLHDVGKIGVPDHILLKPGRLAGEEVDKMRAHVTHGLDIIGRSQWLRDAGEVIGGHHEKYGGDGYHRGLRGEAIPLTARIFAIADVFDALTSERPYKDAMTVRESIAVLQQGAGKHFDPALLARFTTIAADLHARFANDYEAARNEVSVLVERYFRTDLGVLLD